MKKSVYQQLADKGACKDGVEFVRSCKTLSAAWEKCVRPEWMIWAIRKLLPKQDDEKFRLFACWCARNTPVANGRTTWDLLTDERSRRAIEVAEAFARGKATLEELAAAEAAAWAAEAAAWAAAAAAAEAAAEAAAAEVAVWAAVGDAGAVQAAQLRKIYGNPFNVRKLKRNPLE